MLKLTEMGLSAQMMFAKTAMKHENAKATKPKGIKRKERLSRRGLKGGFRKILGTNQMKGAFTLK